MTMSPCARHRLQAGASAPSDSTPYRDFRRRLAHVVHRPSRRGSRAVSRGHYYLAHRVALYLNRRLRPVTVTHLETTQPRLRSTFRGRTSQSELPTAWTISSESTPCPARVHKTGGGIRSCFRKTKRHSLP